MLMVKTYSIKMSGVVFSSCWSWLNQLLLSVQAGEDCQIQLHCEVQTAKEDYSMFATDSQISPDTVRAGFISCNPTLLQKQLSVQLILATFLSKDCFRIYYILEKSQKRKPNAKKTNYLFSMFFVGLMTKYVAVVPRKVL